MEDEKRRATQSVLRRYIEGYSAGARTARAARAKNASSRIRAERTQRVARAVEDRSRDAKGDTAARRRVASVALVLRPEVDAPLRHRHSVDVAPLRGRRARIRGARALRAQRAARSAVELYKTRQRAVRAPRELVDCEPVRIKASSAALRADGARRIQREHHGSARIEIKKDEIGESAAGA